MKTAIVLFSFLVFGQCQLSFSQVYDSVCLHDRQVKNFQSIFVRKIGPVHFPNYKINSEYFNKGRRGDSLFVSIKDGTCLPTTVFVGEYTNAGSVHFIDYMRSQGSKPIIQIENICGQFISRNQLPDLNRLVVNIEAEPVKIVSAIMYIQIDTGVV